MDYVLLSGQISCYETDKTDSGGICRDMFLSLANTILYTHHSDNTIHHSCTHLFGSLYQYLYDIQITIHTLSAIMTNVRDIDQTDFHRSEPSSRTPLMDEHS